MQPYVYMHAGSGVIKKWEEDRGKGDKRVE